MDSTLRLFLLGDAAGSARAFEETAVAAEGSADRIDQAGTRAGTKFGDSMDKATTRAGHSFSGLANTLGNFGIPTGGIDKFGEHLAAAETKGQKFSATMSEVGKVTLEAGAVGLAATAVEAVHLADKFDIAQASLETATKNAGQSWAQMQSDARAASGKTTALVVGNSADVDQALATLETATHSTSKAMGLLTEAENLAAYKHISLADAAGVLAKVEGGNVRILAQMGINLDVASGKLHSIQSAEEAVQKATLGLNTVQAEVNQGTYKGAQAAGMLAAAHMTLRDAELNLAQSQNAIPTILDALNAKTKDAANTLGNTLPGQIAIAHHGLDNLGTDFGEYLTPKIIMAEHALLDLIGWFKQNTAAADALGITIGGALATAVGVFAFNKAKALVNGAQEMVAWFGKLGAGATASAATQTAAATSSAAAQNASAAATNRAVASEIAMLNSLGMTEAAAATQMDASAAQAAAGFDSAVAAMEAAAVQLEGSFALMSAMATGSDAEIAAAQTSLAATITASDATIVADNAAAASSFAALGAAAAAAAPYLLAAASAYVLYKNTIGGVTSLSPNDTTPLTGSKLAQYQEKYLMTHQSLPPGVAMAPGVEAWRQAGASPGAAQIGQAAGKSTPTGLSQFQLQQEAVKQQVAAAAANAAALAGTGIPALGGIPSAGSLGGGGGSTSKASSASAKLTPGEVALEALAHQFEQALKLGATGGSSLAAQGKTVPGLLGDLSSVHRAELEKLDAELLAAHNAKLTALAGSLNQTWATETAKLAGIIASDIQAGQGKIATLQSAITNASLSGLRRDLTGVHMTEMKNLEKALIATHSTAAKAEAAAIAATIVTAQADLKTLIATKYDIALADQTQLVATETTDITRLYNDMVAQVVQGIGDTSKVATDKANAQAQVIGDQAQIVADTLGERGKYGLNLVAQQMHVALDKITAGWDKTISTDQQRVDQAALAGNKAVAAATANLDKTTAHQDKLIQQAQDKVDQAAQSGNQLQQSMAAAALKRAEANAALVEARQQALVDHAKNVSAVIQAAAQAHLAQAESRAKVAEAREQALIQKEEAMASTQFAGTGFTVNIYTDSSDPLAHGIAAGWAMRRQLQPAT